MWLAHESDSCYRNEVSTIQKIESTVTKLPEEEFAAFRGWFAEFGAQMWDKPFEKDVLDGQVDALRDLSEARCTD